MKRSQITLPIILGILAVFLVGFTAYILLHENKSVMESNKDKLLYLSEAGPHLERYMYKCIEEIVKDNIEKAGQREETKEKFINLLKPEITECSSPVFAELEMQGYQVNEGQISISIIISSETLDLTVDYPITIEKEGWKTSFEKFHFTFDRTGFIIINNGIALEEIFFTTPDGKAQIKIPKGTKITDKDGNPADLLSIKVEDRHFGGLENRYNVGETVYENMPHGLKFSQPVEFSMEFHEEDVPEGYTLENVKISYWNNDSLIWLAQDTAFINDRLVTNITHFSWYAKTVSKLLPQPTVYHLFEQRYTPAGANDRTNGEKSLSNCWFVGNDKSVLSGTASPQSPEGEDYFRSEPGCAGENFKKIPDFKDKADCFKNYLIGMPKYGVFSEEGFLDGETSPPESPSSNIKWGLDENEDPYYSIKIGDSCGPACPILDKEYFTMISDEYPEIKKEDLETCSKNPPVPRCGNPFYPEESTLVCNPNPDMPLTRADELPCTVKEVANLRDGKVKISWSKEKFGFFDYHAAVEGKIEPAEGEDCTLILAFEPLGNGVADDNIFKGFLDWTDTTLVADYGYHLNIYVRLWPTEEAYWSGYDVEYTQAIKARDAATGEERQAWDNLLEETGNIYPFYCEYGDSRSSLAGQSFVTTRMDSISDQMYEVFRSKMKFEGSPKFAAYCLVENANIKLKPTHTKNSLLSFCDANIIAIGNGIHFNYPDEFKTGGIGDINKNYQIIDTEVC